MYILQVKCFGKWTWGIRTYETKEEADRRASELKSVGITARVKLAEELYS